MFSRLGASVRHCQSWKDLTAEEVVQFSAEKRRAVCHLNRGHLGDHQDKILALSWSAASWPNNRLYETKD
jgi:hypothetical protein